MPDTFTPINEIGEFGLIDRMRAVLGDGDDPDLLVGIADDAAVYRVGDGRVNVVTTDCLLEGVHFDRAFMPMEYLGFKSISVNVSDVVAMNARPRWATIALAVPENFSVEMVEAYYRGVRRACEVYDVQVVGGDTSASRSLLLSVTVVGEAAEEEVVYRSGARPGDALCVTGDLGGSFAGLKVLLDERRKMEQAGEDFTPNVAAYQEVIRRHLTPRAQIEVYRDWAERGVRPHALIDVSDGLAAEVHHLCNRSGVGAVVHAAAIPIALETRDVADRFGDEVDTYALFGGEDYELLFTLAPAELERLDPTTFNVVGEVTPGGTGVQIQLPEGQMIPLGPGGFRHFGAGDGEGEDEGGGEE